MTLIALLNVSERVHSVLVTLADLSQRPTAIRKQPSRAPYVAHDSSRARGSEPVTSRMVCYPQLDVLPTFHVAPASRKARSQKPPPFPVYLGLPQAWRLPLVSGARCTARPTIHVHAHTDMTPAQTAGRASSCAGPSHSARLVSSQTGCLAQASHAADDNHMSGAKLTYLVRNQWPDG